MFDLILSGSAWFQLAVLVGLAAIVRDLRPRTPQPARRARILCASNRFFGCVMAVMASGHLVAVVVAAELGAITSGAPLWFLYAIGLVLLFPAAALAGIAGRFRPDAAGPRHLAIALNALLALVLVVSVASAPLAVPAVLNVVVLLRSSRRAERWGVGASAAAYAAMLIASFYFRGDF
jgi:hypothetical protein